jgi:hypothetical protein
MTWTKSLAVAFPVFFCASRVPALGQYFPRLRSKLTAADSAGSDVFGISPSLHNGTALIGAYGRDDTEGGLPDTGAAYVLTDVGGVWM